MILMTRIAQAFDGRWHGRGVVHPWIAVLFLAVVAFGIGVAFWAVIRAARPQHLVAPGLPPDPAMETLRLRFARGEIDGNEYAARAAQLSGAVPAGTPPPQSAS